MRPVRITSGMYSMMVRLQRICVIVSIQLR